MNSQFVFSEGSMKTSINNNIVDEKSYKFEYDGNEGKGFVKNNNDTFFVELDNDDLEKIFKKEHKSPTSIDEKLETLLNRTKSLSRSKSKSRRKKSIKKSKTRRKTRSKTIGKSRSKTKSKSKSKTKSTKRRSIRKTKKRPLNNSFMNTIL